MRVFFYLLYHQFAWLYDTVAYVVSLGRWRDWILSVMPELNGPLILELGHGTGHLLVNLQGKGFQLFGMDSSPQMGRIASRRINKKNPKAMLVNGCAQHIPFPERYLQQVVATFPSEYILDSRTLNEIHRILTPGGSLVLLPVAWITGSSPLERFSSWLFRITGQSPEWHESKLSPFIKAGFNIRLKWHSLPAYTLLVIIAQKPDPGNLPTSPKVL